ncbi:Protein CBG26185 [Caenorhabditis briggsae]|uniref:Protein CBG26185 n=1 Tax=Caenorhabditis briggsae TaxID=6238 RepID=B6ILT0_CAEBR|nr:Protein CBG26185 [Caenorhabditis briggsae]CAS00860.1 Protein CBG26185 [Caenorhabditis briggsae]
MPDLRTTAQRLEDVTAQASYWKGKLRIIEKQMRKLEKETKAESDSLRRQIEQLTHQLIQATADKKELQKRLGDVRIVFFQNKYIYRCQSASFPPHEYSSSP